jgi:hypothetical protein
LTIGICFAYFIWHLAMGVAQWGVYIRRAYLSLVCGQCSSGGCGAVKDLSRSRCFNYIAH